MRVRQVGVRAAAVPLFGLLLVVSACGNSAPAATQASPPQTSSGASRPDDVVAIVDGERITAAEIDAPIAASLAKLTEQIYELRKQQVDEAVAARLIAAEAKRQGLTPAALLDREVNAQVASVSEQDITAFVAANRHRIQGDPSALTPRIKAYLHEQRVSARRAAFVKTLRERSAVELKLAAPPIFRATINGNGPSRGPASAPVTIVEFSDFHCPFCRAVQPTLNAVLAKYPQQVRLVYRHLPLDGLHPQARRASEASWCADRQQKFWTFHDRIYAGGADASDATLRRLAGEPGLDLAKFEQCLAGGEAASAVRADSEEGGRLGINGTPGFFVNGRPLSGNQPLEAFVAIIEEELAGTR